MIRFEQKPTPGVHATIGLLLVAIFVADLNTALGTVVWITYLLPTVISLYLWRPVAPLATAGATTLLLIVGLWFSPAGVDPDMAVVNRGFGALTVWVIAAISYRFIQNKLQVRKEDWLRAGQMQLSEIMRGDQFLQGLGENVLRVLSEHLEAHAGAFFVERNDRFRLIAAYAPPSQTAIPEQFARGEGLLGQAAQDGRAFLVRDLPEGYFSIGSALGRIRPRHLLIAPVQAEGRVKGVLEFAFVHPVYGADQEFLERVAESIGIAVQTAEYRTRQKELLEETQRQAEELQAQSEELRVSNEELAEQGRALKESQVRLESQQEELEETNAQLEEQAQTLGAQKDELLQAKAGLEIKARELEQASRYKSDFLANMSHELRTPLNASLILAKLLADNRAGNLTEEQVKYAQTIQSSGNDLLALINDILDLSKIEAGRMEVNPQEVALAKLVQGLERTFRPLAEQKGLALTMVVEPDAPELLETDPQRLEQVLKNLLSNAIKFTEKGTVSLKVGRFSEGRVALTVRDSGIGIPADQQEVIFEPFRQADGSTNRRHGGTGLGLSISRELVRMLGGRIQVESDGGKGSTFTVVIPTSFDNGSVLPRRWEPKPELPAAVPECPAPPAPGFDDDRERITQGGRIILVVEDDEPFARILYNLAHELGFQCIVAMTAEEAMGMASKYLPSAAVLDVNLPDCSGLSVLERFKRDSRTRHIPVHVVSVSDYTRRALSLGAVGYMLKPVKREQLVQAFRRLETRITQKVRRVLIVEDDPVQLDGLQRLLRSPEVEAVAARSASECLQVLKTTTVDCMVLDLTLPDRSGLSILETLSREDRHSFPPVIVYTGRDLSAEQEQRLRKYSKSIIIKGAKSPERLLDEVALYLHQSVSGLPAEQRKMIERARGRDGLLEGRRILVVEDDVRNVFALTSVLEPKGAEVEIARNGREALEMLERTRAGEAPVIDLVLMDIMMPEMDGYTAIREIRKREEWAKLPIIALTAKAMPSDHEQCLAAGANDYMAKPLEVEKLLSLVRVWMPR